MVSLSQCVCVCVFSGCHHPEKACRIGQEVPLYACDETSVTCGAGGDAKPRHFMPLKSNSKEQLLDAAKAQSEQKYSMGAR